MRNMKTLALVALIAMIGIAESGLAYTIEENEGAIVIIPEPEGSSTPLKNTFLVQGGVKHHIADMESYWRIYNSNGKRYYGSTDLDWSKFVNSMPSGTEIRFVPVTDSPSPTVTVPVPTVTAPVQTVTVPVPTVTVSVPTVVITPVINDENSWVPLQGESCWSSSSNLGKCAGKVANSAGGVVGQFAKGFFGGLFFGSGNNNNDGRSSGGGY